jgi:hypothetical protein
MRKIDLKYLGVPIYWNFDGYSIDSEINTTDFLERINVCLDILEKGELLIPSSINGVEVLKTTTTKEMLKSLIEDGETEIDIRGLAYVYLGNEEKRIQHDLVNIGIRLDIRNFSICTLKNCWLPLHPFPHMDDSDLWNIEIYNLNGKRLQDCLFQIYNELNWEVDPDPKEVDMDEGIHIHNFQIYSGDKYLIAQFKEDNPILPFKIREALIEPEKHIEFINSLGDQYS